MTRLNPGDIVLVKFPFTDLSSQKRRPSVVISSTEYSSRQGDVVILALTSQRQESDFFLESWRKSGLLKETWIKPIIGTISVSLIDQKLGVLQSGDAAKVKNAIHTILDSSLSR